MKRILAVIAVFVCLLASSATAQATRDQLLVSSTWLATHLKDPNLVLLHVGDRAEYAVRHIPGGRFVALSDISISGGDAAGLNLQMPTPTSLRDRLVAIGVSDTSRIVVYYATTQITQATRVMLTLDYAGLGDRSSLLDGGMGAWIGSGHDVTNELPEPKTGVLAPLAIKPIVVDAVFVKANLKTPNMSIVDARLTPFYDGTQVGGSAQVPHKTGHIEGAKSVPWSDLTTDQQTFRPASELQDRFTKAGVKPGDTIVAYCHLGQQATAAIFAARTLGFKVLLYDGSFEDWSKQPEAPVAVTIIKKDDPPNPYTTIEGWAKMPAGRTWGATSAVDIDKDGTSIWVAERCGANRCVNQQTGETSPLDVVLKFDASGTLVKSFGAGLFVFPHGIHVDRDGNIWVTDGQDNFPSRARNAAPDTPLPPAPAKPMGHQIFKFSPDGKLLLTLGKPGGNRPGEPADPASFYQPNDVITNAAGEIFVCEGHSSSAGATARVSKFDKTGKFIKSFGSFGAAPGEFNQPHSFAWDSKGRLFVADRSNNRIQIFDQNGTLLESGWEQYSRISGLWIDRNDVMYAADSESGSVAPDRKDWTRGIRIGKVQDGKNGRVQFFIPDPAQNATNTSSAEGVAVDAAGNIYGAEVGQRALKKYVKR